MRFSGDVVLSSRPMKWNPAVEPAWWQPWHEPLSSRSISASGDLTSRIGAKSMPAKASGGQRLAERMVGAADAAEGRPRDDLPGQKLLRDFVDAEVDGRRIGFDIVDQPRLQRRIGGEPRIVRRVLQAFLGDGVAVDPEYPHEIGGLPAELGLLAGGKADHLRVELELLEGEIGRIDRPAGQPAGIDRLVELRPPAAGNAGAAAVGVGRRPNRRR